MVSPNIIHAWICIKTMIMIMIMLSNFNIVLWWWWKYFDAHFFHNALDFFSFFFDTNSKAGLQLSQYTEKRGTFSVMP